MSGDFKPFGPDATWFQRSEGLEKLITGIYKVNNSKAFITKGYIQSFSFCKRNGAVSQWCLSVA